jgi:hypothetical protein
MSVHCSDFRLMEKAAPNWHSRIAALLKKEETFFFKKKPSLPLLH